MVGTKPTWLGHDLARSRAAQPDVLTTFIGWKFGRDDANGNCYALCTLTVT